MKNRYKKLILTSVLAFTSTSVLALEEPQSDGESCHGIVRPFPPVNGPEESQSQESKAPVVQASSQPAVSVAEQVSDRPHATSATPTYVAIPEDNLFVPHTLGAVRVVYENNEFFVEKAEQKFQVQRHNLSKELRGVSQDQLSKLLGTGYLRVKGTDNEYGLDMCFRMRGGGPIAGAIAYWATKTLCYGTAVAAAGTAVVATGGAAGAVMGSVVAATTGGASVGATVVGGAIAGAGLATEAATVTTAVLATSGVGGAIAVVESASLGMWGIFTAIPFLP